MKRQKVVESGRVPSGRVPSGRPHYLVLGSHCTGYMLGTNADTRMASQEAVQDQEKQKCCNFCVFVTVFFPVSKSGNLNNWHVPEKL